MANRQTTIDTRARATEARGRNRGGEAKRGGTRHAMTMKTKAKPRTKGTRSSRGAVQLLLSVEDRPLGDVTVVTGDQ